MPTKGKSVEAGLGVAVGYNQKWVQGFFLGRWNYSLEVVAQLQKCTKFIELYIYGE